MAPPLQILVGVKRVLDYTLRPRIKSNRIDLTGLKHSINPFCEIAMEASVQLREKYANVQEIVSISIGSKSCSEILRNTIAMGADRAILVNTDQDPEASQHGKSANIGLEPLAVAKILAKIVKQQGINLVILGKQSIDSDYHQTGPMLAGLLDWPQAICACDIKIDGEDMIVERETDQGTQLLSSNIPMVITTDLRLNKPRFLSLGAIMKAKKKPITEIPSQSLGLDLKPRLVYSEISEPDKPKGCEFVHNVDHLVQRMCDLNMLPSEFFKK